MHHTLNIDESRKAVDRFGGSATTIPRRLYVVVAQLFKRGRTYEPGEQIALDPLTASRFIAVGDIKETE